MIQNQVIKQNIARIENELLVEMRKYKEQVNSFMDHKNKIDSLQTIDKKDSIENQYKQQETLFEYHYETIQRTHQMIETEMNLNKIVDEIRFTIEIIGLECKMIKEQSGNTINELLESMRNLEDKLNPKQKRETLHEKDKREEIIYWNYDNFVMETTSFLQQKEAKKDEERYSLFENTQMINEIKQIEQMVGLWGRTVIFDSKINNWKRRTSEFDKIMKNKSKVLFLMELSDGTKIGYYLNNMIQSINTYISDSNAYLFKFEQNKVEKYRIKDCLKAMKICSPEDDDLFVIGNGDLVIKKEDRKHRSSVHPSSFDYHDIRESFNFFTGNTNLNLQVKHFVVIQMHNQKYLIPKTPKNPSSSRSSSESPLSLRSRSFIYEKQSPSKDDHMEELTDVERNRQEREFRLLIEEWCCANCDQIIFDSKFDDWNVETSTFDEKIFGKERLVFIIEDNQNNLFGCYVDKEIDQYQYQTKTGEWKGNGITDPDAFCFTLRCGYTYQKPMKFKIKSEDKDRAFILYKKEHGVLFGIGDGHDMCIMKENNKNKCYCKQTSFNYKGKSKALNGKDGENDTFTVTRIQVFQMIETEEQKKKKEQKRKKRIEKQKKKFKKETNELKEISLKIEKEKYHQIQLIEEMTCLEFSEILFDSSVCNWKQFSSTFDQRIYGKEKVVILLEDTNGNVFGCYINSLIDRHRVFDGGEWTGAAIADPICFVFSLESNGRLPKPMKFDIKTVGIPWAFQLYKQDWGVLFAIGGSDIVIMKENNKDKCWCKQNLFDYQKKEKVLVGVDGDASPFTIEKISVFQMKSKKL